LISIRHRVCTQKLGLSSIKSRLHSDKTIIYTIFRSFSIFVNICRRKIVAYVADYIGKMCDVLYYFIGRVRGVGKGDMSPSEIPILKFFLSKQYRICDIQSNFHCSACFSVF